MGGGVIWAPRAKLGIAPLDFIILSFRLGKWLKIFINSKFDFEKYHVWVCYWFHYVLTFGWYLEAGG